MESCNSGRSHEPQTEDEFSDGPRWPGLSRVPGRTEHGNDAVGEPPCPGSVSLMSLSRPHTSCSGQSPREPHVRQGRRGGLAHPGRQGCPPPRCLSQQLGLRPRTSKEWSPGFVGVLRTKPSLRDRPWEPSPHTERAKPDAALSAFSKCLCDSASEGLDRCHHAEPALSLPTARLLGWPVCKRGMRTMTVMGSRALCGRPRGAFWVPGSDKPGSHLYGALERHFIRRL